MMPNWKKKWQAKKEKEKKKQLPKIIKKEKLCLEKKVTKKIHVQKKCTHRPQA